MNYIYCNVYKIQKKKRKLATLLCLVCWSAPSVMYNSAFLSTAAVFYEELPLKIAKKGGKYIKNQTLFNYEIN